MTQKVKVVTRYFNSIRFKRNNYIWAQWNVFSVCLCFVCLENSFEVKIEAASNDITDCPCDDKPSIGTLCFLYLRHH